MTKKSPPQAPSSNRQNIYPKGPYQGGQPAATNGRALLAGVGAGTGAVRQPTGQIRNLSDPTFLQGVTTVEGAVIVPAAVAGNAGNFGSTGVQCPNGKQLVITDVTCQAPATVAQDTPFLNLYLQFLLNKNPVSALLPLGAPTIVYPAGVPTRNNVFAPVQNFAFLLDFDEITLLNYNTGFAILVAGLWCAGAARLQPVNRGT